MKTVNTVEKIRRKETLNWQSDCVWCCGLDLYQSYVIPVVSSKGTSLLDAYPIQFSTYKAIFPKGVVKALKGSYLHTEKYSMKESLYHKIFDTHPASSLKYQSLPKKKKITKCQM